VTAPEPGRSDPGTAPPDEGIARNTAFALFVQLTTAGFTAVLTLFLVRALGPAGYGLFALAVGIGALLTLPSDFGISPSAARFVAESREDPSTVAAVLAGALRLKVLIGLAVSGALLVAAPAVAAAYATPELTWPLRGVAIALLGQNMMFLFQGAFVALRRVSVNLRLVFSESAMETVTSVALVLLGGGASGAAFGRAAGYAFGGLIAIVLAARLLGRRAIDIRRTEPGHLRRIAGYAGALLVIDAAFTLFNEIDVLIIGALVGTAGVGLFQAPTRLVTFLHYPGYAVAAGVAPRLARSAGESPDAEAFSTALRYLIVLQSALAVGVLLWAEPIVDLLLGAQYAGSAEVLRALAPFVFLSGLAPLVSLSVNYLGEVRRRIPLALITLLINLVVDIVFVPRIGIVAGAIGTSAAYAVYVPGHFIICYRVLGFPLRPVLVTLGRSACAALALAVVLGAFGTSDLSAVDWVAGTALGGASFLLVLIVLGEITLHELRAASRAVINRMGRTRS